MADEWLAWAAPQRWDGRLDRLWREVHDTLAGDPSDEDLCGLAVETIEPLIDLYWTEALDEFEAMARRDPRLRRALSCCDFDARIPAWVDSLLMSLVRPQDNYGGMSLDSSA